MNKINIFILAAGRGERLRPITYHMPKPLMPILGKPVLEHVLENISVLPFHAVGINLHHKKEALEEWITHCPLRGKITLFPEENIMDTGGALKHAEWFLRDRTFLVHNADIFSDIPFEPLLEHHRSSKDLVTLAVHDYPKFNNVIINENGYLKDVGKKHADGKRTAFTGVALYEPEFLKFLPRGVSSVVDAWIKSVAAGYRIGTFDVSGCYWNDIGTPSAYASAVFHALRSQGETVYIHPTVKECGNLDVRGYAVVEEGCEFRDMVMLKNCIVLPESVSPSPVALTSDAMKGGTLENCILGPDFKVDFSESDALGMFLEDGKQLIGTGGSDRKYYRVKRNDASAVLMQCSSDDQDYERHLEYTRFFLKHAIPVPSLLDIRPERKRALFEDAGDISLYTWLKCPRQGSDVERIYRDVIDVLVLFHSITAENVSDCPLLHQRVFDYDHFQWEGKYFLEYFVTGIRSIRVENGDNLEKEFHVLALRADSFPKTILHRDFQSQNIMIMRGQKIRIIDYQGARIGPPAYDVASILWDPYYRLEDNLRERLLDYYIDRMIRKTPSPIHFVKEERDGYDENSFRSSLLPCRLQRHMQALGAYAFLSSMKGKKYFLNFVPEGLRLLREDIALSGDDFPVLHDLIMRLL